MLLQVTGYIQNVAWQKIVNIVILRMRIVIYDKRCEIKRQQNSDCEEEKGVFLYRHEVTK